MKDITVQVYVETDDPDEHPLLRSLWYLANLDGELELEFLCEIEEGEPRTWEDPGAEPDAHAYEYHAVLDGDRYLLPGWAWGVFDARGQGLYNWQTRLHDIETEALETARQLWRDAYDEAREGRW